ncbi:unnamed protein product [Ceutorhynchus assimilis]|uniref:Uncharacterized protein n=1 Tax=Ceutorhynchus assimilis TaxID=467358 RepID=A0A9N9MDR2_9CUCU|nr:unnamed protein product [Ceutorhynchus assimilis]
MMTSIDTLSKENDLYAKDLKKANLDLLELREKQHIVKKEVKNLKTDVNNFKKQVAETTENIKLIQEKVDSLEATPHQLATANISEEIENMITEMEERKLRLKNVIILNINESIKANRIERSLDEKQTVPTEIIGKY